MKYSKIKKYINILKNSFQIGMIYRADSLNWLVIAFLSTITSIIMLGTVAQSKGFLNYDKPKIVAYLILGLVLERFMNWYLPYDVSRNIEHGTLSNTLLKPINLYLKYFLQEFGRRLWVTLFYIFSVTTFWIVFNISIKIQLSSFLLSLISLTLGILISVLLSFLVACISFWTTRGTAFINFFFTIVLYLEGKYFPLDVFPKIVLKILRYTPFPYTYFYTIKIFLGENINNVTTIFTIQFIWVLILILLVNILWKSGLKKYESIGI